MSQFKSIKKYFVEYFSVTSGIRVKKTLFTEDYILYTTKFTKKFIKNSNWSNFETDGTNIISLIIKVKAKDLGDAVFKSLNKLYEITAYLSGIFQVPFFIVDPWDFFVCRRFYADIIRRQDRNNILFDGHKMPYIIGHFRESCRLIGSLPNLEDYKRYEDIFYLWRSASDFFNELGWRFLNYIRIIELITKKQRGGSLKSKKMYAALPSGCKKIICETDFIQILKKWGNPTAHGNVPNAVIPKVHHGQFDQDTDALVLLKVVRELIKDYIDNNKLN